MPKMKVFISSVQKEFAAEREALFQYFIADPLLSAFFEPVLFEKLPAASQAPDKVYIDEVGQSQIYLGLLGCEYGYQDPAGVSPTEHEYDHATTMHLDRLVFIKGDSTISRHPKEEAFIQKVGGALSRKRFETLDELKHEVSKSLFALLQQKGLISHTPFDASLHPTATLDDIDDDKIESFVWRARRKRGFPLQEGSPKHLVLAHLNMMQGHQVTNSAILVFCNRPQRFFPSAMIKCAHFHGLEGTKPIADHKEFKGDVFLQVDQAIDFVLSKISLSVGTREKSNQAPLVYEIPRAVIGEAIVNAIAHRDYNSHGSVQVRVFKDRVEVTNPGRLVPELTIAKLRIDHGSYPTNPLLAECLYQVQYIERFGTGTMDMIQLSRDAHLIEPKFDLDEGFKVVLWRPSAVTGQVPDKHRTSTGQVPDKYRISTGEIERVVWVLAGEMKRSEIQVLLDLKHRETFIDNYLQPSINEGFVEPTIPDKPNSPKQRYRLTKKGILLKKSLEENDDTVD